MTPAAWPRLAPAAGTAFIVLFVISTAFPILAALQNDPAPTVLGILDVAGAALMVLLGFTIEALSRPAVTDAHRALAWWVLRGIAGSLLLLVVIFFVQPGLFRWEVLLVGLAWRAWLLVWVLPAVIASVRGAETPPTAVQGA